MKTFRLPLLLFSSLCVAFALAACQGSQGENASSAGDAVERLLGPLDVVEVTRGSLEAGIVVTGTLEPAVRIEVKAQVPGTLGRVRVDRGERVTKGQALAVIAAEGIRSQAASAESSVASAKAGVALAERQLESARLLHEAGALSDLEFEQAKTGAEAARAQLAAAEAMASSAREQAQRATVRAPITGFVSDRTAESGEAVNPGQVLFTVVDITRLELQAHVGAAEVAHVKVGQTVEFSVDAFPGSALQGTVARIEPTANAETRQVGVYLQLDNREGLVGGLFARGRILSNTIENALLVPTQAVREEGLNLFVWAVRDGKVVKQRVMLLGRDDSRGLAAIEGPLDAGTTVLVTPARDIEEGTAVTLAGPDSGQMDTGKEAIHE